MIADNRTALREVGGMEKLVDFIGNKVKSNIYHCYIIKLLPRNYHEQNFSLKRRNKKSD